MEQKEWIELIGTVGEIIYSNEDYGVHGKDVFKEAVLRLSDAAIKEFSYAPDNNSSVREIVLKASSGAARKPCRKIAVFSLPRSR